MKLWWMAAAALLLTGCVSRNVTPVTTMADGDVCVVKNPAVRTAMADIMVAQLSESGYRPTLVDDDTPAAADCRVKAYYEATWRVHWGMYLATANIEVYQGGSQVGMARYRAPYASLEKHGRTEPKIRELIKQLFPQRG